MTFGVLLYPSLNEKDAWLKRYQAVHKVDMDDAGVEYRRRRRAMSRLDINMVEFFSDVEKDPTDPNNTQAIMARLGNM